MLKTTAKNVIDLNGRDVSNKCRWSSYSRASQRHQQLSHLACRIIIGGWRCRWRSSSCYISRTSRRIGICPPQGRISWTRFIHAWVLNELFHTIRYRFCVLPNITLQCVFLNLFRWFLIQIKVFITSSLERLNFFNRRFLR